MKSLTQEQQESYKNAKTYYICKEKFQNKYLKDKKHPKVRSHFHHTGQYRDAVRSIRNLKYSVPKQLPVTFHYGFYYDYNFIMKELVEKFKKQFTFLGENKEKYITFTLPIEKEVLKII